MDREQILSVEKAAQVIRAECRLMEEEQVEFCQSAGRVLAKDVLAQEDYPPFNRSPLDGFALRSADLDGASRRHPVTLRIAGTVYAGTQGSAHVGAGEAARIMTGGRMPDGADCVVRQEEADVLGETVRIFRTARPYENYVFQGEDVRRGSLVLERGRRIGCVEKGILAAVGAARLTVYKEPRVCLFSSGDELVPLGSPRGQGQIYDTNLPLLEQRLRELGVRPVRCGYLRDSAQEIHKTLGEAAAQADLIVTTGAVSVGERDVFHQVVNLEGCRQIFWKVDMKPGTPLLFWKIGKVPVISLSGNPFAAAATFELLVRPALARMTGEKGAEPKRVKAVLAAPFPKSSPGRRFIRGRLEEGRVLLPAGHSSGMLSSMLDCNCLVDIPAGSGGLEAGQEVWVMAL